MSNLNKKTHYEYDIDMIENIMSLRKPQKRSLKILDDILDEIELSKTPDISKINETIGDLSRDFKELEHDFLSMTFALATGVGKTKLMGAFITYLYTQKGVKNFFVVAPGKTIYDKLKNDIGNPSDDNVKYVFKGVGCFSTALPNVYYDDDFKTIRQTSTNDDNINIFIFNIDKFNKDSNKMKDFDEVLGSSFFEYMKSLDDLVMIMDESHHYRSDAGFKAINELNPVLGIELTATPQETIGKKTIPFKNVVFEYPLSKAIRDNYTRTPYALTRSDFDASSIDKDELDKIMLNDGILHHENMIQNLIQFGTNNNERIVKPFMLVVCTDTPHADKTYEFIKSNNFINGKYKDKVINVHSNTKDKNEVIKKLLDVEKSDNPIEIVIHVNILKEGWDVNNLYTIVPLRTATSKTLREQTVGRGLRLPFGRRTGDKLIDSVAITAHDKFEEIIKEAQSPDSIFKADGVIYTHDQEQKRLSKVLPTLFDVDNERGNVLKQLDLDHNDVQVKETYNEVFTEIVKVATSLKTSGNATVTNDMIKTELEKTDLGVRLKSNALQEKITDGIFKFNGEELAKKLIKNNMFIPKIKTENFGEEKYIINDFNFDLSELDFKPTSNDIYMKNLTQLNESITITKNKVINIDTITPEYRLVSNIRLINEIDYEKCTEKIQEVVLKLLTFYRSKYKEEEVNNICVSFQKAIIENIKNQLLRNLTIKYDGIIESIEKIDTVVFNYILDSTKETRDLYLESGSDNIKSLIYNGAKKAVVSPFKFDSEPERKLAIVCEESEEVIQWLRPDLKQFNITYNRGRKYQPDFVVETEDTYYLVEVKGKDRINDPDVQAKKERAISYCKVASEYNVANGHKPFVYMFIPHDEITISTRFNSLLRFVK